MLIKPLSQCTGRRLAESRASALFRNWVFPGILTRCAGAPGVKTVLAAARTCMGQDSLSSTPAPKAGQCNANAEPWGHSSQLCHSPLGRQGSDRDIYLPRGCKVRPVSRDHPSRDLRDRHYPRPHPSKGKDGKRRLPRISAPWTEAVGRPEGGAWAGPVAALGWTPHFRPGMRQEDPCLISTQLRVEWPDRGSWGSLGSLQDTECLRALSFASLELGKSLGSDLSLLICEMRI